MKIAVIGAGIVGITTAYELASDGHAVSVFEQRNAAAEEASFANAGIIAPGYVAPWASPGTAAKLLRFLLSQHAPIKLKLPLSLSELGWLWQCWRACKPPTYQANRQRMQSLASYSQERLHQITTDLQLEYDRNTGYLVLLRSEKDRARMQPGLQVLRDSGFAFADLSPTQARAIEPALNLATAFVGAISLPNDEVANCRQFALQLKEQAQKLGVKFELNSSVDNIKPGNPASILIAGEIEPRNFDAVVLCAGAASGRLLRGVGLRIPLAPVYGYSISAPVRETLDAPRSAIMDEHYKIAISRLGNRVRVSGSAQIGGRAAHKSTASIATLYKVLQDWFPGAVQLSNTGVSVQEWKGARAMLPDGPPVLGGSGKEGLWLNLGHGASGWALACGSARVVADMLAGKAAAVDVSGFDVGRFRG